MKSRATGMRSVPEMEFLCTCIHPTRYLNAAAWLAAHPSMDWPGYVSLATNHHVVPLAYRALKTAKEMGAVIPAAWLTQLRRLQTAITAYNLRALSLLFRLQQCLRSRGIQLIPIKGPILAIMAYGDIALRQFEDLDLIVHKSELLKAVDFLEEDGFVLRELSQAVNRSGYLATLQNWSLYKTGAAQLDLKPVLISHCLSRAQDTEFMAAACRQLEIDGGGSVSAPGPEAMLLAVCMDGANEMWFKLSAIADVAALLTRYGERNWCDFIHEASRLGQKRTLLVGVGLAHLLMHIPLPPAFQDALSRDAMAWRLANIVRIRILAQTPRHAIIVRQSWFAGKTRERLCDRWRFWCRLLFVPGAYELNFLPLPKGLFPLLSLFRPFRLAWDVLVRGGRHRQLTRRLPHAKVPDNATCS